MSTKIKSSGSTFYFNNGRSCHKINGLCNLPTIKWLKKIDQPLVVLNLINTKYGFSRVITRASSSSSSNSPSSPSSSSSSSSSLKKWLWGFLLTVILPAAGHKGGLLLGLKGKIDQAIETVDHVAEVVEEIAEEVEEIAEEVEEKLPSDSKIKEALESIEDLANTAAKEARKADDIIHKVKEMEEEIEKALLETGKDQDKK